MSRRDMEDMDRVVAARVLYHREAAGLTQMALGEKLGITFQQVQKYEGGKNRISAGRLWDIAVACEAPIQSFFEPVPETQPENA